ncbi:MAG: CHASE domain-containing protein [Methyloceanibacter sp.]
MPDRLELSKKWPSVGHAWPIVAAGCLGLAVAVSAWFTVSIWEDRLARAKFTAIAGDYGSALQDGLEDFLGRITALRAFYDASVEVDIAEFALFTSQINRDQGDLMRLVWCPRVSRDQRAEFEQEQRESGLTDFAIRTWTLTDPMPVSPARDEYFPILYSTVASRKSATLGTDINSEQTRHEAILRARDGNILATAQNVQLRNPIVGLRSAFIGVLPVYRKGMPLETVADRRENTLGMIVGAFQTAAVFNAILDKTILPKSVDIYLYPAQAGPDALPVYMRGAAGRDRPIKAEPQKALAGLPVWSTQITAGDASWDLVVVPMQGGLESFYRAWLVLAAVLLVFGSVLAYMWASLRHALRLESANSRILELAQTDLLTNLANRRAFTKRLTMAFNAAWRGAPPSPCSISISTISRT